MQKNQIVEVEITDLSYEAMGVGHVDGETVFVTNTLPGEIVKAKILKAKKNFAFAKIEEIVKESPDRVKVPLRQSVQGGLASLAHLTYDKQLAFKKRQVVELLKKAHLDDIEVADTLESPLKTGYRNKAQVPVRTVKGQLEIGFFRRHSHDLVPLEDFFTNDPEIDRVLVAVRDILREYHVPAYDEEKHAGEVRYLEVRRGVATGDLMVVLICLHKDFKGLKEVTDAISEIDGVKSIFLNHNPQKTNVILGKHDYHLWGKKYIDDKIGDLTFEISPQSFFQINSSQTPRLYKLAIDQADLKPSDMIVDAYSGIGTIGLSAAKYVREVRGVEVVKAAVKDAKNNARLNQIHNAKYYAGKAEELMPKWADEGLKTDVIFVDPPRKGLTPEFIDAAVKTGPEKVVYISCNPATLVRDIQLFMDQGYTTSLVSPVDMFPQTPHVESVTVLERQK